MALFLSFQHFLIAQKPIPQFDGRHKNVFVELLGPSIAQGIHFDMRLKEGTMRGPGFKAGIGRVFGELINSGNFFVDNFITFPLEFNYTTGQRRSSLLIGAGVLPMFGANNYINLTGNEGDNRLGLVGSFFNLGYRFQPIKNSVMFQITWSPIFLKNNDHQIFWLGLGLGYGFK